MRISDWSSDVCSSDLAPWPKTLALKSALLDWLVAGADDPLTLFDALRAESLPHAGIAPDAPSDVPAEAMVSPIFIRNPVYGTRCSTIVSSEERRVGKACVSKCRSRLYAKH